MRAREPHSSSHFVRRARQRRRQRSEGLACSAEERAQCERLGLVKELLAHVEVVHARMPEPAPCHKQKSASWRECLCGRAGRAGSMAGTAHALSAVQWVPAWSFACMGAGIIGGTDGGTIGGAIGGTNCDMWLA